MGDISCFYTLSSPWAYLGGPRLQDIVCRHRVRLVLKPFDFQEVVPRTGGVPIRTRPQPRREYHRAELARWRDYLGLPLKLEPRHYPMANPAPNWNKFAGWMVIAAQQTGADAFPSHTPSCARSGRRSRTLRIPPSAAASRTTTASMGRRCWPPR
jgi:2-hydroxychromene-2-carboxylate isomerase